MKEQTAEERPSKLGGVPAIEIPKEEQSPVDSLAIRVSTILEDLIVKLEVRLSGISLHHVSPFCVTDFVLRRLHCHH